MFVPTGTESRTVRDASTMKLMADASAHPAPEPERSVDAALEAMMGWTIQTVKGVRSENAVVDRVPTVSLTDMKVAMLYKSAMAKTQTAPESVAVPVEGRMGSSMPKLATRSEEGGVVPDNPNAPMSVLGGLD